MFIICSIVKNKWKSQESSVAVKNELLHPSAPANASSKAPPPPPPPPARSPATASPSKGIDSEGRATMMKMKKTDSFFGSNPLARKPGGPKSPGGRGLASQRKNNYDDML